MRHLQDRMRLDVSLIHQPRHYADRALHKLVDVAVPRLLGTITSVDTIEPVVALTFDDGPHPESTPRVVDLLDRYGARGTFFVVGKRAEQYPEIVERAARSGHAVANHTWDHPALPTLPIAKRRAQIRACDRAIAPFGVRMFRPPFGRQTLPSRLDLWRCGHQVITWSLDAKDWESNDASWIVERLLHGIRPGSIILLHDAIWDGDGAAADRRVLLEALERLMKAVAGRFRFVTVPELLRSGRPVRINWCDPWTL